MNRLRRDADRGAVLLIVLLFLVLFASFGAALIGLSATSLRETAGVTRQRMAVATAEGGVDVAIRRGLSSFQDNIGTIATGQAWACPGSSVTQNGMTATTTCTVVGTAIAGDTYPKPPTAITTLGGSIVQKKRGALTIGGDIISGGSIVVDNKGSMSVVGTARAVTGSCPRVTATGGVSCPAGPAPSDPAYPPDLATAPTNVASVPGTCATEIVSFDPGANGLLFNNASTLSALTNRKTPSCVGKIIWFRPGTYYFNFTVGDAREWVIDDANVAVVGGAAKGGWDTQPSLRPSFPGGCDAAASPGVQFVFGGSSRVNVKKGSFEVCRLNTTGQSIALFGPGSDAGGYTHQSGTMFKVAAKARAAVQGTVYAPLGVVELDTSKVVTSIVSRGIIARSVKLTSGRFIGKTVSVPPAPANSDVDVTVRLVATVDGKQRLDVAVSYSRVYTGSSTYNTSVSRWQVLR